MKRHVTKTAVRKALHFLYIYIMQNLFELLYRCRQAGVKTIGLNENSN